jgi:restriction system protein
MGRRQSGGLLEGLFDVAAVMPWWIGMALAAGVFVGLHLYGTAPTPAAIPGKPVISVDLFFKPAANVFKWIVPAVLLLGSAVSAFRQFKRRSNVKDVVRAESFGILNDMTWQEFEALVSEAFKLRGFSVQERGGASADGGIDLLLRKGHDKYLVQCKQWRATRVGVVPVRELFGVMTAEGAAGGYLVTSGSFTEEALAFAAGRNLELVNGQKLFAMFDEVRAAVGIPTATSKPSSAPACPSCGAAMIRRTARKGASAGQDFWGCSKFPACKGTRPI